MEEENFNLQCKYSNFFGVGCPSFDFLNIIDIGFLHRYILLLLFRHYHRNWLLGSPFPCLEVKFFMSFNIKHLVSCFPHICLPFQGSCLLIFFRNDVSHFTEQFVSHSNICGVHSFYFLISSCIYKLVIQKGDFISCFSDL